jgi:hypothetical protein
MTPGPPHSSEVTLETWPTVKHLRLLGHMHLAMIVAMAVVRVMQMAVDQVVNVIPMGNRRMPTSWTVNMVGRMPLACMSTRAGIGIGNAHFELMLLDLARGGLVVQMAIVQIIDVVPVLDRDVSTIGTMDMVMIFVLSH